ncbi:MAG: hypothetical protein ACTS22_03935 [Phycisphaerales bacterium]
MSGRVGSVILLDGDLPGLVALASVSESTLGEDRDRSPVIWPMALADGAVQQRCLERQAALYGAIIERVPSRREHEADVLLDAARWASEHGARQVIVPWHAGVPGACESVDTNRAAEIVERVLLVERLVALETSMAPTIDAPYADLTDRQIGDLVLDMGLPLPLVWWAASPSAEGAASARERWSSALDLRSLVEGEDADAPTIRRVPSPRRF